VDKSPIFQYLQNLIRYRLSLLICCLILVQACSTIQNTASGQFQAKGAKFGLLLMAHGGTEEWNEAVQNATTEISDKYPVEIAFGMADAGSIEESVRRLEGLGVEDVGVVRMFVSGESWYERTQQILGILEGAPSKGANETPPNTFMPMGFWKIETDIKFHLSEDGLADATEMDEVIVSRIKGLIRQPEREVAIVIAHGTGSDEEDSRWVKKITQRTETAKLTLGLRDIKVFTLREDWFAKRGEAESNIRTYMESVINDGLNPLVIPFRVHGFGPYARVLEGLDYRADKLGLLPHENVNLWVANQLELLRQTAQRAN
jgi:hypothetical protein